MRKLGVALAILVTLLFADFRLFHAPRDHGPDLREPTSSEWTRRTWRRHDAVMFRFVYATELDSQKAGSFETRIPPVILK